MLTSRKDLAKTSSTPGKTQLINHFNINDQWYLVDLPGYGYARVSKQSRESWQKMINNYIFKRQNLLTVFVLIDSRISPQKIDIDFINFLGNNSIPLEIIFTKTDKQNKIKTETNVNTFRETLKQTWEELPKMFLSSAVGKNGKDEILKEIEDIIPYYKKEEEQ
jgi:GTP-binding protein